MFITFSYVPRRRGFRNKWIKKKNDLYSTKLFYIARSLFIKLLTNESFIIKNNIS